MRRLHKRGIIHDYIISEAILVEKTFTTKIIYQKILLNYKDENNLLEEMSKKIPSGYDNVLKNRIRWMIYKLKIKKKVTKIPKKKGLYKVL
jgi:hypothetical protein